MSTSQTGPAHLDDAPPSRGRRWLLIVLVVLLVLGGLVWGLARFVIRPRVAGIVASRLETLYGAPVEVSQAEIGMNASSVQGLKFYEAGASKAEKPWVVVNHVGADIPLSDLARGEAIPHQLTLDGAAVTLRFDKEGHLLTRLPKPKGPAATLPAIHLQNGRLALQQEGRPEFSVEGVIGDLHSEGERLRLTATVTDPTWGNWTLEGAFDRQKETGTATLHGDRRHVTQAMLDQLPFLSPAIWREVQLEGDTPVQLTARFGPTVKDLHYRVELQPENVTAHISAIELTTTDARGQVAIEDEVVRLVNVESKTADGTLHTDATLDFQPTPSRMDFQVRASHLDVKKLPASWKLPEQLRGYLTGEANLHLTLLPKGVQTSGDGEGQITDAWYGELRVSKPITLKLRSTGKGFLFANPSPPPQSRSGAGSRSLALMTTIALVQAARPDGAHPDVSGTAVQLADLLNEGVTRGLQALTQAGTKLLARIPAETAPQTPQNALEINLSLDDVDVQQLLRTAGVKVPLTVAGQVSLSVQAAIPLGNTKNLKAYRFHGTATSKRLTIEGMPLEQMRAQVDYANGVLRLGELTGQVPPLATPRAGLLHGTARIEVVPPGTLSASLKLDAIPLAQVAKLAPTLRGPVRGTITGELQASAPVMRLRDANAWQASGTLSASGVLAEGLQAENLAARLRLQQGLATLTDVRATMEGLPVTGSADLRLQAPYPFHATLNLRNGDLAAVAHLPAEARPPVTLAGRITTAAHAEGTLRPFTWGASGDGSTTGLQMQKLSLGAVRFRWKGDSQRLQVTDVRAGFEGGELTGTATIPLRPTDAGNVDLRFHNLDVGALAQSVARMPLQLQGRASGSLQGTLPPAKNGGQREFTAQLDLQAPEIRIQGIPAQRTRGSVSYRNRTLVYRLDGETLGGRFHVNGEIPPAQQKPATPSPVGSLQIQGVQVSRLWPALRLGTEPSPIGGRLDIMATFRHEGPDRLPVGQGRFILNRLRWERQEIASGIQGDLVLTGEQLRLANIAGLLGQGFLNAQVVVNLRQLQRSYFVVSLSQVEAANLLAPWPSLGSRLQGPLDVSLRGRLGSEWYGSGLVSMARGRLAGVDVTDWRLPLDWSFAPSQARGRVDLREGTGQLANGRVDVRTSFGWGYGTRAEGQIRFFNVDLRPLVRQASELSQIGSGHANGRIDFSGNDVHSLNDLTGTIDANLQQTQALQLPVLQQVTPFLSFAQSSNSMFQSGSLRGRFANGILRLDRLSFSGSTVDLIVQGNVSFEGNLNLEVTATTGQFGPSPLLLRLLRLRIPMTGPIPIGLILQASSYLSNRTVHLRVTGTMRAPNITVEPLGLLTDEAFLFFMNRANVPLP
jgi:hypothetical protein